MIKPFFPLTSNEDWTSSECCAAAPSTTETKPPLISGLLLLTLIIPREFCTQAARNKTKTINLNMPRTKFKLSILEYKFATY